MFFPIPQIKYISRLSCSLRSDALASLRRDKQKIYFFGTPFFQFPTAVHARTAIHRPYRPFTLMVRQAKPDRPC